MRWILWPWLSQAPELRLLVSKAGEGQVGRVIQLRPVRIQRTVRNFLRKEKGISLPSEFRYGIILGRSEDSQLILRDETSLVSRYHCLFVFRQEQCLILDLCSINGTEVNHNLIEPLEAVPVSNLDSIGIGLLEFGVLLENDSTQETAQESQSGDRLIADSDVVESQEIESEKMDDNCLGEGEALENDSDSSSDSDSGTS